MDLQEPVPGTAACITDSVTSDPAAIAHGEGASLLSSTAKMLSELAAHPNPLMPDAPVTGILLSQLHSAGERACIMPSLGDMSIARSVRCWAQAIHCMHYTYVADHA